MTSNLFSLAQVAVLRHPAVRRKLRIPERIVHPQSVLPANEGFIATVKKGVQWMIPRFGLSSDLLLLTSVLVLQLKAHYVELKDPCY